MESQDTKTIFNRLAYLIESKKMTPYGFSKELGFDKPAKLYTILRGKVRPSYDTLETILTKFEDVSAEWLLRGAGDPVRIINSISVKGGNGTTSIEASTQITTQVAHNDNKILVLEEQRKGLERLLDEREQTILLLKDQILILREVIQQTRSNPISVPAS
ncbi:helix-turn-helix domain-containing protein [Runella sp.]|uniref:helix-turn-helix domain-containing protein n=1 Tax=Runella sp. TaxID=1960881 RepID=UPI003D109718